MNYFMDWLDFDFFLKLTLYFDIFNDSFFIQFLILYALYLFYSTINIFFVLFYLFLIFFYFGLFLSFFNLELFTAFLWLTECVVIFISIIILFYLNVYGNSSKTNLNIFSFKYFSVFFMFFIFISSYSIPYVNEFFLPIEVELYFFWDNFYESLNNFLLNDFYNMYISFYILNSFETILIGVLLFFGSVVCVNLNKLNRILKSINYYHLFTIYDFFNDFIKFFFLRKQNLNDQNMHSSSTRIFKKKLSRLVILKEEDKIIK